MTFILGLWVQVRHKSLLDKLFFFLMVITILGWAVWKQIWGREVFCGVVLGPTPKGSTERRIRNREGVSALQSQQEFQSVPWWALACPSALSQLKASRLCLHASLPPRPFGQSLTCHWSWLFLRRKGFTAWGKWLSLVEDSSQRGTQLPIPWELGDWEHLLHRNKSPLT